MILSRVIVVDDCDADQFISKIIINRYDSNIEVLQAYDGEEALDILDSQENKPQVIFLDINMPRMDGHEFLKIYSERKDQQAPVVVMLTSSSQERDKESCRTHQCVKQYLEKPLKKEDLEQVCKIIIPLNANISNKSKT